MNIKNEQTTNYNPSLLYQSLISPPQPLKINACPLAFRSVRSYNHLASTPPEGTPR